ncbi:hypothetical protein TNCT_462991 [Trichonephila clavata]|uniref:Uncharacterized protein n=1 Tax=Trichonephila clavata TaxID=2740835 RepID=A0A8X6I547_TRICU|nr:hypothetical protein TNCT_462991 [Trichonephila clavata]
MPIRDPDDLVEQWFNRLVQPLPFLSGAFGGFSTVCSFLAIPFAASLTYYYTAVLFCVLIGASFLVLCFYCFCAYRRLRLNDDRYNVGQQQRIPKFYDPTESAEMRNEDTGDDSMFLPVEDISLGEIPSQLEDSSLTDSEANPVCHSSGDIAPEGHLDEPLPSTSTQKSSDIKSRSKLKEFVYQPSTDILTKSFKRTEKLRDRCPEKLNKQSQTESIEETYIASASKLYISEVSAVASISDGSMSCGSDTRSTDSIISDVTANLKFFSKLVIESSDAFSSTENEAGKCKKDTRSSSGSSFDSEKAKTVDTFAFSFKQELGSKGLDIKRSRSEKDVTSESKAQWPMNVHDSSRSGKRVPEYLKRRSSAHRRDLGRTRMFSKYNF